MSLQDIHINNWHDLKSLLITNPAAAIGLSVAVSGTGLFNMWQSTIAYLSVESHVQFIVGIIASLMGIVLVIVTIWGKVNEIKMAKARFKLELKDRAAKQRQQQQRNGGGDNANSV